MSVDTAVRPDTEGRFDRIRAALTPQEWTRMAAVGGFIVLLHIAGWFILLAMVAPKHYALGPTEVFGVGIGITAYTLGMRHAFDADHIAAIDNTTRKLMSEGQRPLTVGFWFSLGHSSIVFIMCALLAFGIRSFTGALRDESSTLHTATDLFGTLVSGAFLMLIGIVNLVILVGILKVFRRMRQGAYDEKALEEQLNNRGLMNRILKPVTKSVRKPWHMYPVGLLFGLGFDTVTEVGLLVIAGGAAAVNLPWYAILCLPILFAAGMSLLDTIDGSFMNFAYGWAFSKPVRKVFYNITITGLSVAVALIIGMVELLGITAEKLGLSGGFWSWVASLDLNVVGYAIVALFVLTWVGALLIWRYGRIEEKWSAELR